MTQVSVIVPFWNAGQYVLDALRSIAAQDVPVHEILVLDQGGNSSSQVFPEQALSEFPDLKIHQIGRTSPAVARNLGLEKVTGDVVAFLDDDDLWPVGKLQRQLSRLDGYDVVGGLVRPFGDKRSLNECRRDRVMYNVGAYIYRREALEQLGGFNTDFVHGEDVDLTFRAANELRLLVLRSVELYYRRREGSLTTDIPGGIVGYETALLTAVRRAAVKGCLLKSIEQFLDQADVLAMTA
jgi:glycosyltransferase involved in cell wall biosynthesis